MKIPVIGIILLCLIGFISCKGSDSSSGDSESTSSTDIDTTAPTVTSVTPTDNQSAVSIADNVSVTFSEAMDNSTITTNTSNTTCSGSLQLSSDNFSTCI